MLALTANLISGDSETGGNRITDTTDSPVEIPFEQIHAESGRIEIGETSEHDQDTPEEIGEEPAAVRQIPDDTSPEGPARRDLISGQTVTDSENADSEPARPQTPPDSSSGESDVWALTARSGRSEHPSPSTGNPFMASESVAGPAHPDVAGERPAPVQVPAADTGLSISTGPVAEKPAAPVGATLASADPSDEAARSPALRQTVQAIEILIRQPSRTMEITLSPQELGHVRMTIIHGGNGMNVAVMADRPETLDLLRRHVDQLAAEFLDLGYADIGFSFGTDPRRTPSGQDILSDHPPPAADDAPDVFTFIRPKANGLDLRL